jgi:hypothetical protein
MSGSGPAGPGGSRRRWSVDAGRLWIGGVMAGVVGAGVVVVGFIVTRGILDVPVLVEREGKLVNANVWWYALGAFAAALVATGLLHVLLLGAPRPFTFYGWITGLAVAIAALVPFTTGAKLDTKVALCALNLAAGVVVAVIVGTVGRSAFRPLRPYDADPAGPVDPYRPQVRPVDEYRDRPGSW